MTEETKKDVQSQKDVQQKKTIHVPRQSENHLPGEHANAETQLNVEIDKWLDEGVRKEVEKGAEDFAFNFPKFKSFRMIVHRQAIRAFAPLNMKFTIRRCACLATQDKPGYIKTIRERSFRLAVVDQAFTQMALVRSKIPHEAYKAFTDKIKKNQQWRKLIQIQEMTQTIEFYDKKVTEEPKVTVGAKVFMMTLESDMFLKLQKFGPG